MIPLTLGAGTAGPARVLCLGAHCDDIEIGCGGTLLRWLEERPELDVRWVVFSSDARRAAEARASAQRFLGREPDKRLTLHEFRDGFLPYQGAEVKDAFERLKAEFAPDVVFTHYRHDLHQDHRLVSELTWNTFRGPLVLEYEIPKWDGDLGNPNAYVALSERHLQRKIEMLLAEYGTQRGKAWFEPETFRSLARLRGMEAAAPNGYAEAFYARKLVLGVGAPGSGA
ncbi:MAG TPA: PIG-L deacetylase family protein [Myxococcota bacterium]|nr:PIG-L deacetylase family protein [Myxococcota bacterium]